MQAALRTHLRPVDLAIVGAYLIGITLFGLRFRKSGKAGEARSLKSYFLADNSIPWWAIALSIVSAETSTLTIISIPGVAFAGNFGFLQVVLGYMLGRIVVAGLFLPRYFAGEMLTAYQLIDQRFGGALHKVTAGLFLCTRAAAEGVRVFAVSIVVGLAIGTGDVLSIAIISMLTLLYTFEGGMAAVVWTDVVQMAIYVGGTVVALLTLGTHVAGGWSTITTLGAAAGKFHMFNFALNLTTSYTFWAGVLGGTFLTMASHGTDQLMVQRLLAARNLKESRLALLSSGVVIFMQFALFLLIGVGLWVFYGQHAGSAFKTNDYIFPTFIVREMPIGIAGLLVAAILAAAMSNLSAALNSLSSTSVVDFYMRFRPAADDRGRAMISKSSTAVWAIVLFAIAVYSISAGGKGHVVEIGLSIASVAYGCLLGVFLLGTLTKYASQAGAIIGMIVGFAVNLALWQWPGKVLYGGTAPIANDPVNLEASTRITIPHVAFTWYVLIGAIVTFAVGSLMSLVFRNKRAVAAAAVLVLVCTAASAQSPAKPDFSLASQLITDAIAAHKLPGAVLLVGHDGKVVFEQAYGNRKADGEPGLDGKPSPAEPMTLDTIFDMASLTKCLATATSIMQLYDAGKLTSFDDPVEKYLPDFNATHDAQRAKVTVRMLLTHFSGEGPDVSLKDPWGLAAPDRNEGFHRALTEPLAGTPGTKFVYSDINFILLGKIVESLSGMREDEYAQTHIFQPLGMKNTRYLPVDKACGPHEVIGAAIAWKPVVGRIGMACPAGDWSTSLLERIAPTTHDDEGKAHPETNPHYDMLTRGTVHDPTTRRMGGVAGHAGVFSTADDMSLYASALLDKLLRDKGPFPVKQSTLKLMIAPEEPGREPGDLAAANAAEAREIAAGEKGAAPLLAPEYPAVKGKDLRGFGWDIDTAFSKPRGRIFPIGSFGHTGFTGTTLWIDPASDTYVVLLSNAVHPRGNTPISSLRGEVATAVATAMSWQAVIDGPGCSVDCGPANLEVRTEAPVKTGLDNLESTHFGALADLAKQHDGHLVLGLMTNQTGLDSAGRRTVDILHDDAPKAVAGVKLATLFSPEHGIFGKIDAEKIVEDDTDPATGLHVTSLYGPHDADKRPKHEQLAGLDAVVIDLQDVGVHFWTYESVLGYFLEAAAIEQLDFHHPLDIIVLDRPNPVGGLAIQGPTVDPDHTSYVAYMPIPSRSGLTYGELARYFVLANKIEARLTVVPMTGWKRSMMWNDTGLKWVNPSPNLRSPETAIIYPGLGLVEYSNLSVGRGSDAPFSFFGAGVAAPTKTSTPDNTVKATLTLPANGNQTTSASATLTNDHSTITPQSNTAQIALPNGKQEPAQRSWFHADEVAMDLNARSIPGVTFSPIKVAIADDKNHYPYHGQTIEAVRINVKDASVLDTPEMGIEILSILHRLYPTQFQFKNTLTLVANKATMDALARNEDPRKIAEMWKPDLERYRKTAQMVELYH